MKKFLLFLAAAVCSFALFANEIAVRNANTAYIKSMQALDFTATLRMMHPEYTSRDSKGREHSRKEAEQIAETSLIWEKFVRGELPLPVMYETALQMRNAKLSDKDRAALTELEKSEDGKKLKQRMAAEFKRQLDAVRQMMTEALKSFKLLSCSVSGKDAVLIYSMRELNSKKIIRTETRWRKVGDSWLIIRSEDSVLK